MVELREGGGYAGLSKTGTLCAGHDREVGDEKTARAGEATVVTGLGSGKGIGKNAGKALLTTKRRRHLCYARTDLEAAGFISS